MAQMVSQSIFLRDFVADFVAYIAVDTDTSRAQRGLRIAVTSAISERKNRRERSGVVFPIHLGTTVL